MSEACLAKENINSVSVVIPTLGGDSLLGTIEQLNRGTIVPNEILVCIPEEDAYRVEHFAFPNVTVLKTNCRGQVAQRAIGFCNVKNDLVFQLDDDIIVDTECIGILVELMHKFPYHVAIAPCFFVVGTGRSFYIKPDNNFLHHAYYKILNGKDGYQPGTITKAATNVGFDPSVSIMDQFESEWLPGGCILHNKSNLILDNFYPFKGKAYCEDLYHSQLLRNNGIRLLFSSRAVAWIGFGENISFIGMFKQCIADFRARIYLVKMYPAGRSFWRIYCYYILNYTRHFLNMLRSKKGKT